MLKIAICCLLCGISFAQSDASYVHRFLGDGDKIEPEINFLSQKYTKDQKRKWSLHADNGVWALVFQKFSLEYSMDCEHDYLQVEELTNGSYYEPIRPVRYCGERVPMPYVSSRSRLDVVFVSDDIWEMGGFLIQVLHSEDTESLMEKMKPFVAIASQNQAKTRPKLTQGEEELAASQHPLFLILIGCSVAALVIFGILLTYFVLSIRKKESKLSVRAPDSLYIHPSARVAVNRKPDIVPTSGPRTIVCSGGRSGKRYSKDNKNNTARKTTVTRHANAHHNNLYVLGNLSKNG